MSFLFGRQRLIPATRLTAVVMAVCICTPALARAQSRSDTLAGRRLDDALRVLQMRGLRLVFSSELVTPDMRVREEPRATAAREKLTEILQPHGLIAENGPGGVIQVVRQKRPAGEPTRAPVVPTQPKESVADRSQRQALTPGYIERVTVTPNASGRREVNAGSDRSLGSSELDGLSGYVADDPLRIVQALPGVAGGDDFRSEYSVRGSAYRHAGVVVEGVVAPWLQHAALGRGDTGTMTMLRGDVIQEATLLVGAYPRKDGSQLGPQLNLTLREGSRTAQHFRLGVSGTSTTLTAEGPLGSSTRGSWLVGVRNSHAEWPVGRNDHQSTVFGFRDIQSKLVYDVRRDQEVSVTVVAGMSNIERDDPNPITLADGVNRAVMVSAAWRSVIGSRTVVTQRISSLTHQFLNRDQTSQPTSGGANAAYAYRMDVTRALFGGVVDAGAQVRRVQGSRHDQIWRTSDSIPTIIDDVESSWLERSGHVSFRRSVGLGVTLDAGLRVADSTLVQARAVDRWLRAEWAAGPRWLVHGSTGVMHQFPGLEHTQGWVGATRLGPERASYADLGIGQRLSSSVRWDVTAFRRQERDGLREPDLHPRLVDGVLGHGAFDEVVNRFENTLSGSAHGMELKIERSHARFSGWIGYAYGVARYTDAARGETFPADFDQRHALNASGIVTLPRGIRAGLTLRGGTNFPVPGYLVARAGHLFAGGARNQVRLPAYARLDVRADRTFRYAGRRFTLFGEALNVLNRVNVGLADGAIMRDSGEALGFTERLFPRLVTAGVRFEF
jgi:hypothetical protein